uniref:Sm domain-containing protein n=1 Tax=Fibrocapsa japonica TaxID=94617 RepID=A0A7S2XWT1_9STRA|mmetsp:Transcript_17092/g.24976  ORF Transcript_17092/g.24976 Transcript_17092/m.24976 type:complete len:104 (+) Transcript_17092:64-375(+)|eukprot:CAMPEP_0113943682 /NCGR_PEP_ID=MMETSP1339-20121228/26968_1 /TAXON_ID=94617 /ORGANISM="Fibrocapsa japonica" /LENGTH=103 /DNA_ID=CAMNT_0000948621 /DNA_START=47 /DNA_END=358 /DNA_ORIENTATION=- /assembly_acc=CAM_ASM_000762
MATGGKRENVLDLNKYVDQGVRVKFQGGREVHGILKGFDQLVNLVLDETVEFLRDPDDPYRITNETRTLGLVVCRGPQVSLISPVDGMEEIANPFLQMEEEEG